MNVATTNFVDPFSISGATLKSLAENKKSTNVTFDPKDDTLHVLWDDEQRWVDYEKQVNSLPTQPKAMTAHSKQILDVLHQTA